MGIKKYFTGAKVVVPTVFSMFNVVCITMIAFQWTISFADDCIPEYEERIIRARQDRSDVKFLSSMIFPLPFTGPMWVSKNISIGKMVRAKNVLIEAENGWGVQLRQLYERYKSNRFGKSPNKYNLTPTDFADIIRWANSKKIFCPDDFLATRFQIVELIEMEGSLVQVYLEEGNKLGASQTSAEPST